MQELSLAFERALREGTPGGQPDSGAASKGPHAASTGISGGTLKLDMLSITTQGSKQTGLEARTLMIKLLAANVTKNRRVFIATGIGSSPSLAAGLRLPPANEASGNSNKIQPSAASTGQENS